MFFSIFFIQNTIVLLSSIGTVNPKNSDGKKGSAMTRKENEGNNIGAKTSFKPKL